MMWATLWTIIAWLAGEHAARLLVGGQVRRLPIAMSMAAGVYLGAMLIALTLLSVLPVRMHIS